jgi:hypothetical protein
MRSHRTCRIGSGSITAWRWKGNQKLLTVVLSSSRPLLLVRNPFDQIPTMCGVNVFVYMLWSCVYMIFDAITMEFYLCAVIPIGLDFHEFLRAREQLFYIHEFYCWVTMESSEPCGSFQSAFCLIEMLEPWSIGLAVASCVHRKTNLMSRSNQNF